MDLQVDDEQGALVEGASFNGATTTSIDICTTWPDWSGTQLGATEPRFDLYMGWVPSQPLFSQGIAGPDGLGPTGPGISPAKIRSKRPGSAS